MDISIPFMPDCDGLLFFTIGTYIAISGLDMKKFSRPIKSVKLLLIPVLWVTACIGYTALSAVALDAGIKDYALVLAFKTCSALGFISVFIIYDFTHSSTPKKDGKFMLALKKSTFIIFCTHEPLMHLIFQAIVTPESSDAVHLMFFFGLPIVFILLGMAISLIIRKKSPSLHSFLTGNR